MSHFYGTVQGGRGAAHRCGHASTGLRVEAKSWNAAIRVSLSVDKDGADWARVSHTDAKGKTTYLYAGPLSGPKPEPVFVGPQPTFTLAEIEKAKDNIGAR